MPATVRAYCATGSGPTNATCDSADSASITFGRDDSQTSALGTPIPGATGTNYSYLKYLFVDVTVTSTTTISNRRLSWASSPATGINVFFLNQPTYTQNNGVAGTSAGNYPPAAATNGATPAGYTQLSTTPQVWDTTGVSTGSSGKNGNYVQTTLSVDNTYAGGAGTATFPNCVITYDEA